MVGIVCLIIMLNALFASHCRSAKVFKTSQHCIHEHVWKSWTADPEFSISNFSSRIAENVAQDDSNFSVSPKGWIVKKTRHTSQTSRLQIWQVVSRIYKNGDFYDFKLANFLGSSPKIFIFMCFQWFFPPTSFKLHQWLSWRSWHWTDPSSHAPCNGCVPGVPPVTSTSVLGTTTSPTSNWNSLSGYPFIIGLSNISSKTSGKRRYNPPKATFGTGKNCAWKLDSLL